MGGIKDNTVSAIGQMANLSNVSFLGKEGVKVVIFGNSITRHAPSPQIGWTGDFGMAASCEKNDYVHLLFSALNGTCPHRFMVVQVADYERRFKEENALKGEIAAVKGFCPDIIVGRLSENVIADKLVGDEWKEYYGKMLGECSAPHTRVIVTTGFWKNGKVDEQIRQMAKERGFTLVELNDLDERDDMKAIGNFEHAGVAAHPNDKGMQQIANRILCAIKATNL